MEASSAVANAKTPRRRGRPRKIPEKKVLSPPPSQSPKERRTPEKTLELSRKELEESGQILFEAIRAPNSSVETVTSDWIEAYESDNQTALLVLINFIIRASGCPNSISREAMEDEDSIVDNLRQLQEAFQKESISEYPLVSKSKELKKFRKNLVEFFTRLFRQIKHSILYDEIFCETIAAWVIAMSSSVFRPFRHTATTITHAIVTQLCDVAQEIHSEINVANRQINSEQKSKGSRNAKKERLSSLQAKIGELTAKKQILNAYIQEYFDCVFVHRYRDVEAILRAECIKELGHWVSKYDDFFLEDQYLRYLGWQLSDKSSIVRAESIKSLSRIYSKDSFRGSLRHFTERFKGRILEMALKESDISVRIPTIHLLAQISQMQLLEESDEYKDKLSLCIYSDNPKVRKAVTPFIRDILKEDYIEKMEEEVKLFFSENGNKRKRQHGVNGTTNNQGEKAQWVTFKSLAKFLVKSNRAIKSQGMATLDETQMDIDIPDESEESDPDVALAQKIGGGKKNRIGLAIQELFNELRELQDWKVLADYLTKDHSFKSAVGPTISLSSSSGSDDNDSGHIVEECYRLKEQEESVLVEVLVASMNFSFVEPTKAKDKKDLEQRQDEIRSEISRTMAKHLPRLLTKYAPDAGRIAEVLQIPILMNLNVYQDLRMTKAYETLVEDIKELFLKHTHPLVLAHAAESLRHMTQSKNLASVTETKLSELQEEVIKTFRKECQDKELSTAHLGRDEVHSLGTSINRLEQLISVVNMLQFVEERDENNQDVASCIAALAQRGMLAHQQEEKIIVSAANFLWYYIMWKVDDISEKEDENQDADPETVAKFMARRDKIVDILSSLVTFEPAISNVRKTAFKILGNIYWLFSSDIFYSPSCPNVSKLRLPCPSSLQAQFASFVEGEIKRLKQDLDEALKKFEDEIQNDMNEDDEDDEETTRNKHRKFHDLDVILTAEQKYEFLEIIGTILRGTRGGFFDIKLSASVIAQFGKFGNDVDDVIKRVIQEFKEWKLETDPRTFCQIFSESLEKSFGLYEEIIEEREEEGEKEIPSNIMESSAALARLFANALHLRETQLMQPRKDADHIVEMHIRGIEHAIELMAGYQVTKQKAAVRYWIKFFKPLTVLLGGISVNDAMTIDAKLQEVLRSNNIRVPPYDQDWEAYYSYVQKLDKILVKFGVKTPEPPHSDSTKKLNGNATRRKRRLVTKRNAKDIINEDSDVENQERDEDKQNGSNDEQSFGSPKVSNRRINHRRRTTSEAIDSDKFAASNLKIGPTLKRSAPKDDEIGASKNSQKRRKSSRKKQKSPEVVIEEPSNKNKNNNNNTAHENGDSDSAESFQSLSDVRITRSGRRSQRILRR
ncbi:hypothetical protein G9A89_017113 [Geosiphon pyriformis]|nr:hypothetical protein G9A89_017113 [Geosiphon pyriformis]